MELLTPQQKSEFIRKDSIGTYSWKNFLKDASTGIDSISTIITNNQPPPKTSLPSTLPATIPPPSTTTNISDTVQKYLFPVAAVGLGILLLTSSKRKSLSGMKIGIKQIGKNLLPELEHVALIAGGMIASQKFLDLEKLINMIPKPAGTATSKPLQFVIDHQGGVKLLLGLGVATMVKNPMVKTLAYGVAIGGLIKEIRTLTGGGSSWVPQIGATNNLMQNASNGTIGANQLQERSANGVLAGPWNKTAMPNIGMVPPTTMTVGCGDYGRY